MSRKPSSPRAETNGPRYYILSLGCPKNTVDSEGMGVLLERAGYRATLDPESADVLIVNTCGFLQSAKEESLHYIDTLARRKKPHQRLIAAGCLVERDPESVIARVPQVDGLLGTLRWMEIADLVHDIREGHSRPQRLGPPQHPPPSARARPLRATAYVKIADGCNASCAFCTIPSFKGKLRSRPFADIVEEAQSLVAGGARELILVAQDTTDYGRDWGDPHALPRLLHAIVERTPDLRWLRLMYAYPGHISDALIEVMATHEPILHYLDLPLQHGDPRTLKRMRRPSRVEHVLRTIERLREAMPDIALRTTFIVGYPGETEEEFQTLLDFMSEVRFDKVGAFTFSAEPGTPAAQLPDQVPDEVKEERWHRLMAHQQAISWEKNRAWEGRELLVLAERVIRHGDPEAEAWGLGEDETVTLTRSYREAPEIDGYVIVAGALQPDRFYRVRVVQALPYDLLAEPLAPA